MKGERWLLVSPYLDQALELSGEERRRYLAGVASEDPALAADLELLLGEEPALHEEKYLEHDAQDLLAGSHLLEQVFGAYTLVSHLGTGGMGSVWLARRNDGRFEGTAAVKLLSAALLDTAGVSRFRRARAPPAEARPRDPPSPGKVWFLASTFEGVANRTCEVPADKAIFLSLGGVFVSFAPDFPATGDPCSQMATPLERVRCDVNNDVPVAPGTSLEVTLDGESVKDLFAFRAQSQPGGFTLRVPSPSFLTDLGIAQGDRSTAVADGYFLFLKPLKRGTHTLSFRMTNPDQSQTGVNYTLVIQ